MMTAPPSEVESLAEARLVPLIQSLAKLARERAQERDAAVLEARLAREERDTLRELLKASLEQFHTLTIVERRYSRQLARRPFDLDDDQHHQMMLANERFDFREQRHAQHASRRQ